MAKVELEFAGKDSGATVTIAKITDAAGDLDQALLDMVKAEKSAAAQKDLEAKFKTLTDVEKDAMLKMDAFNQAQARATEEQRKSAITTDNYRSKLSGMLQELDAADPKTQELAQATQHLWEQFKKGEITAEQARKGLEKIDAASKKSSVSLGGLKNGLVDAVEGMTGLSISSIGIAGALATAGAAAKKAIDAASDLAETTSKVGVVFGDSADQVMEFGETAAAALGMSKNEALTAAGTFGNLFVSMGMTSNKSADMSTALVGLAADLASFNNMAGTDVLEKLRAGLTGETEPLKSLGVNISAAAVEAKAMEMGLLGLNGELTASAKAQATFALILEQTKTAQGDFARTSDGLANQQRILDAQMKDLSATMGQALIPSYLQLVKVANSAATSFATIVTWQDKIKGALQAHSAEVATNSQSYEEYAAEMRRSMSSQGLVVKETENGVRIFKTMHGAVQDVTAQYGVLTRAEYDNARAKQVETQATTEAAAAQAAASGNIGSYTQEQIAASYAAQTLAYKLAESKAQTEAADEAMKEYTKQTEELSKAAENLNQAQVSFNQSFSDKVVQRLDQAGVKGNKYEDALGLVDRMLNTTHLAQKKANESLDAAIKKFAETGNLNEFALALEGNKTQFKQLDDNLIKAQADFDLVNQKFESFMRNLEAANGKEFVVKVVTQSSGGNVENTGAGGSAGQSGRHGGEAFASGGSFVIEPGYANDTYSLGSNRWASSGETVTITPPGQQAPGGDVYVNMTVYPSNGVDVKLIANQVVKEINKARRA